MKFVKDSFEYIPQEPTLEGALKMIELAARTCYKTEDLITKDSYDRIINNVLIPHGHTSPLEFGTIYLYRSINLHDNYDIVFVEWIKKYLKDRFSRVKEVEDENGTVHFYITTTYRTILQGDYTNPIEAIQNKFDKDWKDDLKYWCEPTEFHHKRYCYKFVMDRGGSQSVERHRGVWGISYAQESTRFINYNRDKFEHEITYVLPSKFYLLIDEWSKCTDSLTGESYEYIKNSDLETQLNFLRVHDRGWVCYEDSLKKDEKDYMYLVGEEKWKPEDARGVLSLDIKTEFMMCAYPEDWDMFLFRRCDVSAHPHIRSIAVELKEDLLKQRGEDYATSI